MAPPKSKKGAGGATKNDIGARPNSSATSLKHAKRLHVDARRKGKAGAPEKGPSLGRLRKRASNSQQEELITLASLEKLPLELQEKIWSTFDHRIYEDLKSVRSLSQASRRIRYLMGDYTYRYIYIDFHKATHMAHLDDLLIYLNCGFAKELHISVSPGSAQTHFEPFIQKVNPQGDRYVAMTFTANSILTTSAFTHLNYTIASNARINRFDFPAHAYEQSTTSNPDVAAIQIANVFGKVEFTTTADTNLKTTVRPRTPLQCVSNLAKLKDASTSLGKVQLYNIDADAYIPGSIGRLNKTLGHELSDPKITKLIFRNVDFQVPHIEEFAFYMQPLGVLRLHNCRNVPIALRLFAPHTSRASVEILDQGMDELSATDIEDYLRDSFEMKEINIEIGNDLPIDLQKMLSKHQTWTGFYYQGGSKDTTLADIKTISKRCPDLQSLGVRANIISSALQAGKITDDFDAQMTTMAAAMAQFKGLTSLKISFPMTASNSEAFAGYGKHVKPLDVLAERIQGFVQRAKGIADQRLCVVQLVPRSRLQVEKVSNGADLPGCQKQCAGKVGDLADALDIDHSMAAWEIHRWKY